MHVEVRIVEKKLIGKLQPSITDVSLHFHSAET